MIRKNILALRRRGGFAVGTLPVAVKLQEHITERLIPPED